MNPDDIIALLDMQPHPEGGYYKETFRDGACMVTESGTTRAAGTAIYYLLTVGDCSAWHRVDAAEIWHHYAGAPLAITISENGHDAAAYRLGANLMQGERPQLVVPAGAWQTAESLGLWTLVGCTVAPGFEFSGFEMAPPDWRPMPRAPKG